MSCADRQTLEKFAISIKTIPKIYKDQKSRNWLKLRFLRLWQGVFIIIYATINTIKCEQLFTKNPIKIVTTATVACCLVSLAIR